MAQLVKNPPGFDPWVGKIPWRTERLPTPEFFPGEFHGLYSPWGHRESDMTERLSLSRSSGSHRVESQWEVRASCHSSWNLRSLVGRRWRWVMCMYISDPSRLMMCIMCQQQWAQASQFLVRQTTYLTVLGHPRCLVFFILFYQTVWA